MEKIELEKRIANLANHKDLINSFKGFPQIIIDDAMNDRQIEIFNDFICEFSEVHIQIDNQDLSDSYVNIARIAKMFENMELGLDRKYHNLEYVILDYDDILFIINRFDIPKFLVDNDLSYLIKYEEID